MRSCLVRADDPAWCSFLEGIPHDFYHLPAYVDLCARQEGGEAAALLVRDGARAMLLPLVIRPIPGGGRDAKSPYGYPGPLVRGTDHAGFVEAALAESRRALASEGVVSVFVRLHPVLNRVPPRTPGTLVQHCDTVAVDLTQPEEVLWSQTRPGHRYEINRLLHAGIRVEIDADSRRLATFERLYRRTMARCLADAFYFFDDSYFDGLWAALGGRLHLAVVEIEGAAAAAALITESCGIVQMHLEASDERFAKCAPGKLVYHGVRSWAKERGNGWLHLGGGRGACEDSLFQFKAGFSHLRLPFHTLRLVISEREYRRLVLAHDPSLDPADRSAFFPLYRTSRVEPEPEVPPDAPASCPDAGRHEAARVPVAT